VRVLAVNPYFSDRRGGVDRRIAGLGRALAAEGHEVTAVTGTYAETPAEGEAKGLSVRRLETSLYDGKSYDPPFLTAEGFAKALGGGAADVVDLHYMWTPDFTRSARKLRKGTPIVFTVHNAFAAGEGAGGRASYISESVLKFFMRNCDLAVCVTDFIRRDLVGRGIPADKLRVVSSGVTRTRDAELQRLRALPRLVKEPYAVFAGRIERSKGLDVLVEAVRDLERPTRVILVGAGPELDQIKAQAHDFGVAGRFAFEGYVPEARKRQLVAQADAFVYPATFEPFGLAVLEAMDLGCPVLTTSVGGLPEVAGDAARLVRPGDADALAQALNEIASGATLRSRMARDGRERALASDWPKVARAMAAAYEQAGRR